MNRSNKQKRDFAGWHIHLDMLGVDPLDAKAPHWGALLADLVLIRAQSISMV